MMGIIASIFTATQEIDESKALFEANMIKAKMLNHKYSPIESDRWNLYATSDDPIDVETKVVEGPAEFDLTEQDDED